MTVLNTYDVGGDEISIFFATKDNQIVCQTYNGTTSNFQLVNVPVKVLGTPKFMTSVTWKNTDGRTLFHHSLTKNSIDLLKPIHSERLRHLLRGRLWHGASMASRREESMVG